MKHNDLLRDKRKVSFLPNITVDEIKKNKKNSKPFGYWLKKNWYYHQRVIKYYKTYITEGASILHINCKNGYLLHELKPSFAIGIDNDSDCIESASQQYPDYQFFTQDLSEISILHQFDYIVLSLITMEVNDIQELFNQLQRFCHQRTRIIIESYSSLWAPILWLTQKLGLRRSTRFKNWVSPSDLKNFLHLAGFDVITHSSSILCPKYIPLLSTFLNSFIAHIPLINRLCLHQWTIVRPIQCFLGSEFSVSVIIPCRNEKGNIEEAVVRCPQMGTQTELIFTEGNSTDGTLEEIKRVAQKYPKKNISWFVQDGKGKGDAVRKGFAHAQGDILMILDGDLTMPPEELPKFFDALVQGKGECINGSRLVYGMESEAMTFLSFLANNFFGRLVSWIIGQRIKDTLCGTKVLFKKDYQKIAAQRSYFGLHDPFGDYDLLFGAARLQLKIIDMPIHYKRRTYGKTNIQRFWDVWFLLWICFRAMHVIKMR